MADDGFHTPDLNAPLSLEAVLARVPPEATVRGLVLMSVARDLERFGGLEPEERVLPFKEYPLTEQIRLMHAAALRVYPALPHREALRRMGRKLYPALRETLPGRVLFGAVGEDLRAVFAVTSQAYALAGAPLRARLLFQEEGRLRVRLDKAYGFVDCYHVGVVEGAVLALRHEPRVRLKLLSPIDAEFDVTWDTTSPRGR